MRHARFPALGLLVLVTGVALIGLRPVQGAGVPLYPDLQTKPPSNLYFANVVMTDGSTHAVLRFANTVWNAGPGRLELEGKKRSKIYQNVYDAPVGGTPVARIYLGNDSVFHAGHNHYHLENFASYLLLKLDGNGIYQPTTHKGTKTSFCIIDTERVQGTLSAQYTLCGRALQGLTVGWADTYRAMLDGQWIDLGVATGAAPLTDGRYAVQSIANPANGSASPRLTETNYTNNVGVTYFDVQSGAITNVRTAP